MEKQLRRLLFTGPPLSDDEKEEVARVFFAIDPRAEVTIYNKGLLHVYLLTSKISLNRLAKKLKKKYKYAEAS